MNIRPWNENIWFSPCYVINEWAKQASIGNKKIKKYEEAWVCAVTAICLSKILGNKWWIQVPVTLNDPPDILAMNIIVNEDGSQDMAVTDVEIFEIRQFQVESIEDSIIRKIGLKDYSEMLLIAFVRRKIIFDYVYVSEYLKKLKPKAKYIFLLVSETGGANFNAIQVYPEALKLPENNFSLFCKDTDQNDFITVRRSSKAENGDTITTDDIFTLVP